jgi:hypothetical protein
MTEAERRFKRVGLERGPEKWKPVFGTVTLKQETGRPPPAVTPAALSRATSALSLLRAAAKQWYGARNLGRTNDSERRRGRGNVQGSGP